MSGPRASADLRALEGGHHNPAAPARFPDVRRPAPNAARRRFTACDLTASPADRLPRQTGRRRHERVATIANRGRLGCRPQPATTLVEHRRDRAVLADDGGFQLQVSPHAASMTGTAQDGNLIPLTVLSLCQNTNGVGTLPSTGSRPAPTAAPCCSRRPRGYTTSSRGFARCSGRQARAGEDSAHARRPDRPAGVRHRLRPSGRERCRPSG